jgi:hypothetical protein
MRIFRRSLQKTQERFALVGRIFPILAIAALAVSGCQSTPNFVKPDYTQAVYARDEKFCVQVAQEPSQNPTVPAVPCYGCPVYGSYAMAFFRLIVNNSTGTTVNQTTYGDCMRNSGYAAVPMSEEEWAEFNELQTVDERRQYLLDLIKKAQQQGP